MGFFETKQRMEVMRKFLVLLTITLASVVIAQENSSHMDSYQTPSKSSSGDYATIMDSLHKNQYDDGTNYIISIVPAAVQPTFTMAYFTDLTFVDTSGGVNNLAKGDIHVHRQRLPADYRFGVTGQFSYLLPTDSYLDLFYNYYGISSSASNHIPTGATGDLDFIFGANGVLFGQYHFAEFYFRTRIAILNFLDKYFHNDASFGFSFQNMNLHHHNNTKDIHFEFGETGTDDGLLVGDLGFGTKQKHKVFAFGPSFKWLSTLDLLPIRLRPHNLSFVSEVKFALLYSKYYGKGTAVVDGQTVRSGATVEPNETQLYDLNGRWRSPSNYFVVLNTNLKAGLKYTYKGFSIEGAYKILYFSDEDYDLGSFLRGTLAQGVIPDIAQLFNIFPTTIGFRAFEVALDYKF
jgi:hypothetical protein